jgi:hypothetical protein
MFSYNYLRSNLQHVLKLFSQCPENHDTDGKATFSTWNFFAIDLGMRLLMVVGFSFVPLFQHFPTLFCLERLCRQTWCPLAARPLRLQPVRLFHSHAFVFVALTCPQKDFFFSNNFHWLWYKVEKKLVNKKVPVCNIFRSHIHNLVFYQIFNVWLKFLLFSCQEKLF